MNTNKKTYHIDDILALKINKTQFVSVQQFVFSRLTALQFINISGPLDIYSRQRLVSPYVKRVLE